MAAKPLPLCARVGCLEEVDPRYVQHDREGRIVMTCEGHGMNAENPCPAGADESERCMCPPAKEPS
jgi:hypothetical protein